MHRGEDGRSDGGALNSTIRTEVAENSIAWPTPISSLRSSVAAESVFSTLNPAPVDYPAVGKLLCLLNL